MEPVEYRRAWFSSTIDSGGSASVVSGSNSMCKGGVFDVIQGEGLSDSEGSKSVRSCRETRKGMSKRNPTRDGFDTDKKDKPRVERIGRDSRSARSR
jgi:hypothetical protein